MRSQPLALCCLGWGLCISSILNAQLLDDRQLAIAREAKTIDFAEPGLNQLSPHWKIAPLKIAARDPAAAVETMNEHVEQVVAEYSLLYDLSPEQQSKLRTAADLLKQLQATAPKRLANILSEDQRAEVETLIQASGILQNAALSIAITPSDERSLVKELP